MPYAALFTLLLIALSAAAQTLVFGPNEYAAGDSLPNNQRPRVAYDANGVLHMVWAGGAQTTGGLYYQAAPGGGAFGEPQRVSGSVLGFFIDISSGPTVRTRGSYVVAGWEDRNQNNRGTWAVRSSDGGITWEAPVRADTRLPRIRYYQSVAVFPDGRMAQMWMTHNAGGSDPTYEWAVQTGDTTFSAPVDAALAATHEVCDCCPPDQLVLDDGQTVLTAFRNNISNLREIHITRSIDGGASFPQDYRVDTSGWVLPACPTTGPHLAADGGTVLATWMSALGDVSHIWTARSLDGGATWEPMVEVAPGGAGPVRNYPQVAVRGDLAVVAWEGAGPNFYSQIFAAASTDGGATWGEAVMVSDQPLISAMAASVAIAPDYTVDVVWKDVRLGPARIFRARGTVAGTEAGEFKPVPAMLDLSVYPNPFNAAAQIVFTLPAAVPVRITVLNLLGQEVAALLEAPLTAGVHRVVWNAAGAPSGIYLCRVSAGDRVDTRKIMLLK